MPEPRRRILEGTPLHSCRRGNDNWHGYRSLTDQEVQQLAENLVQEVQQRGPFLSLAEFSNRRISSDALGTQGAIQAAIDGTEINTAASQGQLATSNYLRGARSNISPADLGVGIPGYLTQADVLQSMGPCLTARSDTFVIRAYGSSVSQAGQVLAETWPEAEIQRVPDFVDKS